MFHVLLIILDQFLLENGGTFRSRLLMCSALISFISYDHYDSFVNCTKWSKFSGVRHQACCRVAWLAVDIITIVGCYYYHQPSSRAAATRRRRPEQPEHAIRDIQTKWIPRTMISVFRSVWTKLELFWKCKIWNISYHPLVIQQTLGWTDLLSEGFQVSVRVNGPNIFSVSVVSQSFSWSTLFQ